MWPFKRIKRGRRKKTRHHYWFSHMALRAACFDNFHPFFVLITSPARKQLLDDLWTLVCRECDKDGEPGFSPRDIIITNIRIDDHPAVLVKCPEPHFTTEAHMVCIVMKRREQIEFHDDIAEVRYFTLEKGVNTDTAGDRTVLCAWQGNNRIDYGDGPEPTPEAFVKAITRLI